MNESKKFKEFLIDSTGVVHNKKLLSNILNTLKEDLKKEIKKEIHNEEHPIGSLEPNTSGTNPAEYLGIGTWVEWGKGRVPVGVDVNDSDFDTVEKTGGEKTHTMTENEMFEHYHYLAASGNGKQLSNEEESALARYSVNSDYNYSFRGQRDYTPTWYRSSVEGGNQPFNIQQKYITCYMWKRIA